MDRGELKREADLLISSRQTSGTAKDAGGKNSTVDDDDDDDYSDNVSDIGTAK